MPEDFLYLWFSDGLHDNYSIGWMEQGGYYDYMSDRDLFCTYLMLSI